MTDSVFDHPQVAALIELALAEDIGAGDRTSLATVPVEARARGRLLAKQRLVVCGVPLLRRVFGRLGTVEIEVHDAEGSLVEAGRVIAHIDGPARVLLAGERLALNFLQHLAGIATLARRCVDAVAGTSLVVRDTRKTVPGMRLLAKYAVRTGGAQNHRLALDDALLVKDNHLTLSGRGLAETVAAARAAYPHLPLEVEVRTLDELRAALEAGPDLILLDNMALDTIRSAVALVAGRVPLEVSGGVRLEDLPAVAGTGVAYVAMGALTHSAAAADISLKLEPLR
ncbi:MAG TPA: carboxylating nicotinate-nucleotide diphosphorylase [Candidatus Limnocylindria bacterium]|nr:carboxylating nicotinate-nucleotide diphosphorylase [Candidatus Limnocylindria bacterium]